MQTESLKAPIENRLRGDRSSLTIISTRKSGRLANPKLFAKIPGIRGPTWRLRTGYHVGRLFESDGMTCDYLR